MIPEDARRLEAFLKPSHIVVVATIGRNGMPHLTPNWYYYTNSNPSGYCFEPRWNL